MKEIKAIIRPSKLLEVTEELHEIQGLPGVTVSDIKGFGKGMAKNATDKIVYEMVELIPRIQLEVVVNDETEKEPIMKKMTLLLLIMALLIISGCAESTLLIKASSTSVRSDVFQELKDGGPTPPGYADLRITSSLKTHKPGIYSENDIHGTPEYRLLINVDGQAVLLQGRLQKENSEPRGLRDPEAGEGIRYQFNKKLRLNAGTHRLVVAFPDDGVAVEREITLSDGNNNLVLEPHYGATPGKQRPGFYGSTSFSEGINGFWVVLNGEPM